MIKPLALLREFEHVGARITNSAEHPSVLGWERVGRERLGDRGGPRANGQERMT
jgi:hypothetical protein